MEALGNCPVCPLLNSALTIGVTSVGTQVMLAVAMYPWPAVSRCHASMLLSRYL